MTSSVNTHSPFDLRRLRGRLGEKVEKEELCRRNFLMKTVRHTEDSAGSVKSRIVVSLFTDVSILFLPLD